MVNSSSSTTIRDCDNDRIFLVTGATGAIGKAIARQLAAIQNSEVVLVCRHKSKAEQVVKEIVLSTQNSNVRFEIADLSSHSDICKLAQRWQGPLHVLINNAATTPQSRQETTAGIELQFATNVLGYFWLIDAFTPILKTSAPARVVNVASYWAGGLDLNDLEFAARSYDNDKAYRQSKQANRMLSAAFSEKLKPHHITVNSCHPGDVNSTLSNNLGFGGHQSPDQGAETPVWLATHAIGQQVTGKYFEHLRESTCTFGQDKPAVDSLFEVCLRYK